ncbi:reverse transcriptase domain-containing protein [Tanacetum coccineum]
MSVRLVDRSFQYPIGIAKNMLVEVGKFTFPMDFVILKMEEDSNVPLILGRPFLHTADAKLLLYLTEDTCFSIDVIDEILEEDFDALLDEGSKILYSIEGTPLENKIFAEFYKFIAINFKEITKSDVDKEEIPFKKSPLILIIKSRKLLMNLLRIMNIKSLPPSPDYQEYAF